MSTLTSTPLYGYTEQGKIPHYLRDGRKLTLCGPAVSYIPTVQPVFPAAVCQNCTNLADTGTEYVTADQVAPEVEGVCPECNGTVVLNDLAMIQPHGEYRIGRNGPYWSKDPCAGAGHAPEVTE
ncbi:hypothetical protein AB0B94_30485 [Micromonospora sp. NPDC048986]|uniref:hypothetical protein n=1 Tax=Micromonospora sp. NPDC048986 TaxID=3155644 RepID=UPI0033E92590